jgi:hypothetical protein
MPLYFAYGSNMDAAAMRSRCPNSAALGTARHPYSTHKRNRAAFVKIAESQVLNQIP